MRILYATGHLVVLAVLLALAGWGLLALRAGMVPESFGRQGPYRADALQELAARPSAFQADATCQACHQDVEQERAESLHRAVRCAHCHGLGRDHVEQAQAAAASPGLPIAPAAAWDGKLLSKLDLYVTRDRKICLSCHEAVVGMPAHFKKIDLALHLEQQGAAEPEHAESCFECHGGHNTAP